MRTAGNIAQLNEKLYTINVNLYNFEWGTV